MIRNLYSFHMLSTQVPICRCTEKANYPIMPPVEHMFRTLKLPNVTSSRSVESFSAYEPANEASLNRFVTPYPIVWGTRLRISQYPIPLEFDYATLYLDSTMLKVPRISGT